MGGICRTRISAFNIAFPAQIEIWLLTLHQIERANAGILIKYIVRWSITGILNL